MLVQFLWENWRQFRDAYSTIASCISLHVFCKVVAIYLDVQFIICAGIVWSSMASYNEIVVLLSVFG